ncbi:unnamed protein product [Brassica napus]|uniref:(rape) hypothetical protein n=1 Tax=Brassica napus TaxID=3708 RepID=A0A816IEF6_BRANA|nr:unnamed protein product [Brassica napus]
MRKKYPFIYIHIYDISYNCGEITGVDAKMKDGVLRMIVSRVKVKDHGKKCTHTLPPNTGVCGDDILVLPNENEVKFYGENKEVYEHDESCRIFMGAVNGAFFCAPGVPLSSHHIAWDAEFGVLKVRISPPGRARSS